MQFFVLSALLIGLVGFHFGDSSFLGDRLGLKEGNNNNNIFRKSKGCTVLCSLKINFKKNNQGQQQTCYQLPGKHNATVSECVFNCLKLKGEKLENATQCTCQNGVCIAVAPATSSSTTTDGGIFTTDPDETDEEVISPSPSPASSSSVPSSTGTPVNTTTPTTRP